MQMVRNRRWTALVTSGLLILGGPVGAQTSRPMRELGRVEALIDAAGVQLSLAGHRAMIGLQNLRPALAEAGFRLQAIAPALGGLDLRIGQSTGERVSSRPPAGWDDQDPGDSLYRAARSTLNRGDYGQAAYLFSQIHDRFGRSTYAADSYYWEAFARYRQGSTDNLRSALRLIERQLDRYPDASTHDDAASLGQRIRGQLARTGDSRAAEQVKIEAEKLVDEDHDRKGRDKGRKYTEDRTSSRTRCRDDDDDEKMAALNALLQMDEDRALPILKKVMVRRDPESVCLRRKAVFLISQHSGPEAESMLLAAVRSDPDKEVREQGVFWLSQVGGEHAAIALDSILRSSDDPAVQEKAIFALSQHSSERAMRSLRDYAVKTDAPRNLRENAIFWLGQTDRGENAGFLKSLYKAVKEESLKEKIIFSVAQHGSRENQRWLIDVAADQSEEVELRKKAIFWAGQSGVALSELFALYDRTPEREIREGLIFAYSQRSEKAAVDKLIQIARSEKDKDLRKNAMFWLSQSKDPRVADLLEEMLNK
jgi:HEAT repeat protein